MAIRTSRVVFASTALVAATLLLLWWNAREQPVPVNPKDAPWIGLPKSGMDATQFPIRQILFFGSHGEGWNNQGNSLPYQCGEDSPSSNIQERYVAYIGSHWGKFRKVTLDVHGDAIDVSVQTDSNLFVLPSFPDTSRADPLPYFPSIHVSKARSELEPIRVAWSDADLWHSPQSKNAFSCHDSAPLFLEACVNGKYAARFRNCDVSIVNFTSKLWHAINDLLPPPPKPEWRDADGNPIRDNPPN